MQRVFGIGFNKTGTTSLGRSLRILGIEPTAPAPGSHERKIANKALFESHDYEPALLLAEPYRAFQDRPFNVWQMYQKLDERYPGSRFVLTSRSSESWWRSVDHWLHVAKPHMIPRYLEHLRVDEDTEAAMVAGYESYNQEVRDYFAGRRGSDFLELDFERGDGWEPLCELLGVAIPNEPVPHRNRQRYDESDRQRFLERRWKRRLGPRDVGLPRRLARLVLYSARDTLSRLRTGRW